MAGKISFTWGLEPLDDLGYVEMMLLIHLAGYHYNTETGSAQPEPGRPSHVWDKLLEGCGRPL